MSNKFEYFHYELEAGQRYLSTKSPGTRQSERICENIKLQLIHYSFIIIEYPNINKVTRDGKSSGTVGV